MMDLTPQNYPNLASHPDLWAARLAVEELLRVLPCRPAADAPLSLVLPELLRFRLYCDAGDGIFEVRRLVEAVHEPLAHDRSCRVGTQLATSAAEGLVETAWMLWCQATGCWGLPAVWGPVLSALPEDIDNLLASAVFCGWLLRVEHPADLSRREETALPQGAVEAPEAVAAQVRSLWESLDGSPDLRYALEAIDLPGLRERLRDVLDLDPLVLRADLDAEFAAAACSPAVASLPPSGERTDSADEWMPATEAVERAERAGHTITSAWLSRLPKVAQMQVRTRPRELPGNHKLEVEWNSLAGYLLRKAAAERERAEGDDPEEIRRRVEEEANKKRRERSLD